MDGDWGRVVIIDVFCVKAEYNGGLRILTRVEFVIVDAVLSIIKQSER